MATYDPRDIGPNTVPRFNWIPIPGRTETELAPDPPVVVVPPSSEARHPLPCYCPRCWQLLENCVCHPRGEE